MHSNAFSEPKNDFKCIDFFARDSKSKIESSKHKKDYEVQIKNKHWLFYLERLTKKRAPLINRRVSLMIINESRFSSILKERKSIRNFFAFPLGGTQQRPYR